MKYKNNITEMLILNLIKLNNDINIVYDFYGN